jgi:hypothetical protein
MKMKLATTIRPLVVLHTTRFRLRPELLTRL